MPAILTTLLQARLFSDFLTGFFHSLKELIQDDLQQVVDFLFGTILTIPRIETEGPLTFGRPTGQPLSELGDFLTPSLFNAIATQSYEYVWIGVGGGLTVTALVMYLGMVMFAGQYEMLQFNTTNKKAKNPIVGFLLIIFWFPGYLLLISISHGFVHAVVSVDEVINTIASVMMSIVTGVSLAVGASSVVPGGVAVGVLIILLLLAVSIIAILPYIVLVIVMVARSVIMGMYLLFAPFLIAGSWSGLPSVSEMCDKILWKSVVVAVLPMLMVPIFYVADVFYLPVFGSVESNATTAGVNVGIGGAIAFAILGYLLLITVWVGFGTISPSAQKAGQTLFRSGIAAAVIGGGRKLKLPADQISRASEMTVRVGPARGVAMVGSGFIAQWKADEDDGWDEYEDGRSGNRWEETGQTEANEFGIDLQELQENVVLNPEAYDGQKWIEPPQISELRLRAILNELDEAGVSRSPFAESQPEFIEKLNEIHGFRYDHAGREVQYAIADAYNKRFDEEVRVPNGIEYDVIGVTDRNVGLTTTRIEDSSIDPMGGEGRLIYDPVDMAFEADSIDPESRTPAPGETASDDGEDVWDQFAEDDGDDEEWGLFGSSESGPEYGVEESIEETTDPVAEQEGGRIENENDSNEPEDEYSGKKSELQEYLRTHPDATAMEAIAQRGANPTEWKEPLDQAMEAEEPHEALQTPAEYEAEDNTSDEFGESYSDGFEEESYEAESETRRRDDQYETSDSSEPEDEVIGSVDDRTEDTRGHEQESTVKASGNSDIITNPDEFKEGNVGSGWWENTAKVDKQRAGEIADIAAEEWDGKGHPDERFLRETAQDYISGVSESDTIKGQPAEYAVIDQYNKRYDPEYDIRTNPSGFEYADTSEDE